MNLEKAELKMQLAQSWAKRFEEIEEGVQKDAFRLEGSIDALRQAAKALDQHRAFYQSAVDADEMTFEQCTFAMDVITRCVGGLQNLVDRGTIAFQMKQGELKGIRSGLSVLEKDFQAEQQKVLAVAAMMEEGTYEERPVVSAAADIQQRREAAREAKKVTKKKATRKKATRKKGKTS